MVDLMTAGTGVHSASTRVGKTRDWAGSSLPRRGLGPRARRPGNQNDGRQHSRHSHRLVSALWVRTDQRDRTAPYGDNRFGIAKRDDMHVVVLASA